MYSRILSTFATILGAIGIGLFLVAVPIGGVVLQFENLNGIMISSSILFGCGAIAAAILSRKQE